MPEILVGTCGFCVRQAQYFRTFPVIEIQHTFYQPPELDTALRWRRQAPEAFEFTLKAFQAITHPPSSPTYRRSRLSAAQRAACGMFRDTPTVRQAWRQTRRIAEALRATLVVFQCPPRFGPTDENIANLRHFFHWAQRGTLRFGWEPRGPEWTPALVRPLCRELGLIHVVDPLSARSVYGTPRYFRLHGQVRDHRIDYQHRYSDAELRTLLSRCTARRTYCLFNNASMYDDARAFQRMAGRVASAGQRETGQP